MWGKGGSYPWSILYSFCKHICVAPRQLSRTAAAFSALHCNHPYTWDSHSSHCCFLRWDFFFFPRVKLALETNYICLCFLLGFRGHHGHLICISVLSLPRCLCCFSFCQHGEQEQFPNKAGQTCDSLERLSIYICKIRVPHLLQNNLYSEEHFSSRKCSLKCLIPYCDFL